MWARAVGFAAPGLWTLILWREEEGEYMKKIAFRAWDKELKARGEPMTIRDICKWYEKDHKRTSTGSVKMFMPLGIGGPEGRYEFLQFTGLLDKNGKEIYEGDIVKKYEIGFGKVPVLIEWEEKRAGWSIVSGLRCEVVGNIYENPELLK